MSLNISVIYGSVRKKRQGIKGARFIVNKCRERGHDVKLIDPAEFDLPLIDKTFKEFDETSAPPKMKQLSEMLVSSDAFIIVTAEYNHAAPPALLNLMNHFMGEYFFKPSAIASYSAGPFGGVRAAMHLRSFLAELGTPSIPSIFPMSKIHSSFDDKGNALDESYNRRVSKFLSELEWYAEALKTARRSGTPY